MSIFYGWKLSALSMGGNIMLQGASLYCMNAFMEPLCDLHGWSRMEINFSLGLAAFLGQVAMPMAAAIAAKYSLRWLMTLGALAGGLATCAMGLTSDLRLFTLFYIVVWVSSQFCGGVVGNALMSNWFSHYRGIAFGIANSGTSLSGVVLPFATLLIINYYNVTVAYLVLGGIACALAPLSWHLVRRTPQMLNMHPDGLDHEPQITATEQVNLSLKSLARRPAAWFTGIAFGLGLMCGSGIFSQLKPRFSDLGIDAYTAMLLATVSALFGTIAKYVWGEICDKTTPLFAARALMFFCAASFLLLLLPPTVHTLALFGIIIACGIGGLWVVLPALVAYYFGSANFLGVYKFVSIFLLLRCAGFPVMGLSHEYMGNYLLADFIFGGSLLLAFILTLLMKSQNAVENTSIKRKKHKG